MQSKELVLPPKDGLFSKRAVKYFNAEAEKFASEIYVCSDNRQVRAKSLLGLLSLNLAGNMEITLITRGPDEEKAMQTMTALIESGFEST